MSSDDDTTRADDPQRTGNTSAWPVSSEGPGAPMPGLAGYVILSELGRGGIGVVYLARQVGLNRLCALKMLQAAEGAGGLERERFLREARALATLRHPNILQVYEIGETGAPAGGTNVPFLALEYCEAGSLDVRLAQRPLPAKEADDLVRQIALAVQAGHQAGILHRDIKPSNILLRQEAGKLVPKLSDFGLARPLSAEPGVEATRSGAVVGTPPYMPPEQARGERDIGPAADIYSLGALLYACLTGRPPFLSAGVLDTLLQVINDDPIPVRRLNPSVPRDLETIVHKCLQKDPYKRYASAQALADDLQRHQEGRPIQARPVGMIERAWRWMRRNPVVSALAGLVFVVLLVGILVSTRYAGEAWQQAELAKAREAEARTEAHRANLARHAGIVENGLRAWRERDLARVEELLAEIRPEFRDRWEVRHLRDLVRRSFIDLPGHGGAVTSVAFSADGKLAFTGCRDGQVRIFDAITGQLQRTITVPGLKWGDVHVTVHPAGELLATGASDGRTRLWEVATGRLIHTFAPAENDLNVVAFSPDGKWLLAAGKPGVVRLWDVASRQAVPALLGHTEEVVSADFSPDSTRIATASDDGWIHVWDRATSEILCSVDRSDAPFPFAVAFSPDGHRIACSDYGFRVELRDSYSGGPHLDEFSGYYNNMMALHLSPDGRMLAGGCGDEVVYLWDSRSGQTRYRLTGLHATSNAVRFSPEGTRLLSGAGQARIWLLDTEQSFQKLAGHRETPWALHALPDGSLLSRSADNTTRRWLEDAGIEGRLLDDHDCQGLIPYPDGREFLYLSAGTITRRDARTGQVLATLVTERKEPGRVDRSVALSPDGKLLALLLSEIDGNATLVGTEIHLLEGRTGQFLRRFDTGSAQPQALWFDAASSSLLGECKDKKLRLWNLATGNLSWEAPFPMDALALCKFSPDGAWLAIVGGLGRGLGDAPRSGQIVFLDPTTGKVSRRLFGHRGMVNDAAFSPDGTLLATGSDDTTVRLWDVATGQELLTLQGSRGTVDAVACLADGKTIASSDGKSIRLWQAP